MTQKFSNNARSTLTSSISDTATSLTVQPSAADLFPVADVGTGSLPSEDDWFKATLQDVSGNVEIIYVRTRNSGSPTFSNILRAQEGTTARSFVAGTVVGLRLTALDYEASVSAVEALTLALAGVVPPGSVFYFAANAAPTGYLEADGTAVSRTTYAALFAVTGTTFGEGDGSTTFNLPDLRGEFIRGWDDGRGVDTDRAFGAAQEEALKEHNHNIRVRGSGSSHSHRINGPAETYVAAGASNSLGGSGDVYNDTGAILATGGTETRPRNVALLACIKT